MPERKLVRLEAMRSLVHPAIAVLVPFAFLFTMDGLVRGALLGSFVPRPAPGFRLVVLLAGAVETVSANFLLRERLGGFGARLRELVLVAAGSCIVSWLLSGRPFRGELSPVAFEVLWPVFLAGVQWLLTLSVHAALRERELFLSLVEGREAPALKLAAREASSEAGGSSESLARLRFMVVIFEAIVLVFLVIAYLARNGAGGWWVPVAVGHEAVGVFAMSLLAAFAHEQELLAAGITVRESRLASRSASSAAGLAIVFVAAVALAGARPALPLSILAAILAAISRFFTFDRGTVPPLETRRPAPGGTGGGMREMLEALAARETPAWLVAALKALGWVLAVGAAAAALYLLLRPLLTRDTRLALRSLHPIAGVRRALRRIAAIAAGVPRALLAWLREGGRGAVRVLQAAAAVGTGPDGAAVRARSLRWGGGSRVPRYVREFVRVVRWGERRGVRFDRAEGPGEYASRLAEAVPARGPDLAAAAAAFERIAYSGTAAPSVEHELSALVRAIVRRTP